MNILLVLVFQMLQISVYGYSRGVPAGICMSPYPHHENNGSPIQPQPNNTLPYVITLSSNTYTDGMVISVVIKSSIPTNFKGIILTFKPNTSEIALPVGQFQSCDAPGLQFYTVQNNNNSCLSHSNGNVKPSVVTCTWMAPNANFGALRMSAVIVNSYATFWTRVEQVITYIGATPLQGVKNPTLLLTNSINYTSCGTTKSCIFFPNLCLSSNNCVYMMSYAKSGSYVNIEITGPDKGYLTIGLSADTTMNDDLTIGCSVDPDTNTLLIQTGFTTLLDDGSKIMFNSLDDNIIQRKASRSGTTRTCTFSILNNFVYPYVVTYPTNLSSQLNIFFANGDLYPNSLFVREHDEPPMILVTAAILYSDAINPNTYFNGLDYSVKVHGSLMTVAFMLLLPLAVMIARNFRYNLKVEIGGKQLWFYLHMVCNIVSFILAFSGYFYIISQVDSNWELTPQAHGGVGTVVMILIIVNIIMGFARPDIGAPKRIYFYWAHFINSILIRILSSITFWLVFITLPLRTAFKNWIMIVVIIWSVGELIFSLVYEILRKRSDIFQMKYRSNPNNKGIVGIVLYLIFIIALVLALLCGLWIN